MNTKNNIENISTANSTKLSSKVKLPPLPSKYYSAWCYTDGQFFWSYTKDEEWVLLISRQHISWEAAKWDMTCHVRKTWKGVPIVWHQGNREDVINALGFMASELPACEPQAKPKFVREFVIRIEGEPNKQPVGWGTKEMMEKHLNSLHAVGFFADEVERYYQTNLSNRTVSIKEL